MMSWMVSVGLPSFAQTVEDFKPSEVNQPGKLYPQVNSERKVRVQISAPEAKVVQLDLGGVKYDLTKGEKGVWTGESAPQQEGFHYYQLGYSGVFPAAGAAAPAALQGHDRQIGEIRFEESGIVLRYQDRLDVYLDRRMISLPPEISGGGAGEAGGKRDRHHPLGCRGSARFIPG